MYVLLLRSKILMTHCLQSCSLTETLHIDYWPQLVFAQQQCLLYFYTNYKTKRILCIASATIHAKRRIGTLHPKRIYIGPQDSRAKGLTICKS